MDIFTNIILTMSIITILFVLTLWFFHDSIAMDHEDATIFDKVVVYGTGLSTLIFIILTAVYMLINIWI